MFSQILLVLILCLVGWFSVILPNIFWNCLPISAAHSCMGRPLRNTTSLLTLWWEETGEQKLDGCVILYWQQIHREAYPWIHRKQVFNVSDVQKLVRVFLLLCPVSTTENNLLSEIIFPRYIRVIKLACCLMQCTFSSPSSLHWKCFFSLLLL